MMRGLFIFILTIMIALPCMAQDRFDYHDFSSLPILHEGRIKPLDSFARVELRKIYSDDTIGGHDAIEWLARVLFDPASAAQDPLFTIRDPQVKAQMGLGETPETRFSLEQITPGLGQTEPLIAGLMKTPDDLTPAQRALLNLHDQALGLVQLMGAVNMVLPLNDGEATWLDLSQNQKTKSSSVVRDMQAAGKTNITFRIIAPTLSDQQEWLSPWSSLPQSASALRPWQSMSEAYRNDDTAAWQTATRTAWDQAESHVSPFKIHIEKAYSALKPLTLAESLYGFALLALVLSFWRSETKLYTASWALSMAAMIMHAVGLTLRVIILDRPPVGTLYESLLFVSLIVFAGTLMVEFARRDRMALLGGLGATLALLYAAPVFAPMGDSMEMLVAVLNTGFWLATHVICITIGYGVCVLAAMLAHFALLRPEAKLDGVIHKTVIAGLFFTAFGTMLGGIWADQSWGRFWGWDPKENGALLIVLWLAWVLHGRYGGHLRGVGYRVAVAYLNVVVAVAWFGVNLLNVGLHSYGFTNEMASGLALFCGLETALLAFAFFYQRRKVSP